MSGFVSLILVISTSAIDCLERLVIKMTYYATAAVRLTLLRRYDNVNCKCLTKLHVW